MSVVILVIVATETPYMSNSVVYYCRSTVTVLSLNVRILRPLSVRIVGKRRFPGPFRRDLFMGRVLVQSSLE